MVKKIVSVEKTKEFVLGKLGKKFFVEAVKLKNLANSFLELVDDFFRVLFGDDGAEFCSVVGVSVGDEEEERASTLLLFLLMVVVVVPNSARNLL